MITQTSREAYLSIDKEKLNRRQKSVLDALDRIAPACNRQIAAYLKWPINTVTPRILELRGKGHVVAAYIGTDVTGRQATFWKIKEAQEYGDSY